MDSTRYDITDRTRLRQVAGEFMVQVKPGDLIGLEGELGAGKTTFVKDVAACLGVVADVISPTFVYEQVYELPAPVRGIHRLRHSDLYRLESDDDVTALGLTFDDPEAVYFVEWMEHAPVLRRRATHLLRFAVNYGGERMMEVIRV